MTTLAIVTLADGDCDLFPFWIEHYRSIGVDQFLICVDEWASGWDGEIFLPHNVVHYHHYNIANATGQTRDMQERLAIDACPIPDWILYTDLDEHQEYQGGLHAALAKADAAGEDVVMGRFCDRLAVDGGFHPLPTMLDQAVYDLGVSREQPEGDELPGYSRLDKHFPIRTQITKDLIGTRWTKVMAAKPGVILRPGRHGTLDRPYAAKKLGSLDEGHLVHHFKWRAGIIERIRHKMATLPAEYDWYRIKYAKFLAAVEASGGRVPLPATI